MEHTQQPRALFLVPGSLSLYRKKGVAHLITERDEDGYFARVYTTHFPAPSDRTVRLNRTHTVMEFAEPLPGLRCIGLKIIPRLLVLGKVFWRLRQLIREEHVGIIRALHPYEQGLLAFLLARATGIPYAVSLHTDFAQRYALAGKQGAPTYLGSRKLALLLEDFVLRHAALVMPIRQYMVQDLARRGIPKSRVCVIPHGVDPEPFLRRAPAIPRRFRGKGPVVFVGRLSKENYVGDIISIAEQVIAQDAAAHFVLIGDGDERAALERRVRASGIGRNVHFLGFQPRGKVIAYRRHAAVNLCLMGGFSLIESALSGRPAVSYDVEWHRELIRPGKTGVLIREHDTGAAAAAVLRLLRERRLGQRLGAQAQALAKRRYSPAAARAAKIRCYERLLRRHSR